VIYSAAKLFFAYGLGNAMTFPMSVGASTVLLSGRPDAGFRIRDHQERAAFYFFRRADALRRLARGQAGDERSRLSPSSLVRVGWRSAAAACRRELEKAGRPRHSRWHRLDRDAAHFPFSNRPGEIRYGTSGKPVPGYDAKIVGDDGKECGVTRSAS
jgi:benzoate-CoA ligase